MNLIGIDYGEKYVGLAVAQTPLAEPLKTVTSDHALDNILQVLKEYHIDKIVIGLSENRMAQKTRAFAHNLKSVTSIPIEFHDETLTSQETRQKVAQMGLPKKRRQGKIDHLVAAAILQDYLDSAHT